MKCQFSIILQFVRIFYLSQLAAEYRISKQWTLTIVQKRAADFKNDSENEFDSLKKTVEKLMHH